MPVKDEMGRSMLVSGMQGSIHNINQLKFGG